MRTWLLAFMGWLLMAPVSAASAEASGTFVILHTNDFHGRHQGFQAQAEDATSQTDDPGEPDTYRFGRTAEVGGLARLATVVTQAREQHPDAVLLLHAGDTFSDDLLGNLTKGAAVIELMNSLGFDFMALGNHDFDYGPERTRELQDLARFPMRAANITDADSGEPVLGDPTLVLRRGDVRVGLLAMGYTHTPWTASKDNVRGLKFGSALDAARKYVPRLREEADVVVVVSHLGTKGDEVLAREVPGIDIIVGGHSHDHLVPPKQVGQTWIVQALSDAAEYGQVEVRVEGGKIRDLKAQVNTLWADQVSEDPAVARQVDELRQPHRERLEEVLFTAAKPIARDYKSESAFDKLVAEILRQRAGADVAMLPGVGYGLTLGPGPVTREALYTLLAHPAKLATVTLTGAQILETLQQSATNQKPENPLDTVGGLLQSAGLSWTVDLTKPVGERVRDVRIAGKPIEPKAEYRVATHSGMLEGIHRYDAFAKGKDIQRTETKVVDAVEEALRGKQDVQPPPLGDLRLISAR